MLLTESVKQSNFLELPGLVAGYLNGEFVSVGLGHADWIRVQLGHAVVIPTTSAMKVQGRGNGRDAPAKSGQFFVEVESTEDAIESINGGGDSELQTMETDASYFPVAAVWTESKNSINCLSSEQLQKTTVRFFQSLREAFKAEQPEKLAVRRDIDVRLRRIIAVNQASVCPSCLLLGEWVRSLLWAKTSKGLLRIPSVLRYFNALSVCFQAIAYDHDLPNCEDDEVTDFYRELMEVRTHVRPDLDVSPESLGKGASFESASESKEVYKSQRLALNRLRDFHRFVKFHFCVEDPDWSEIEIAGELLSISPGVICEREYQHTLRLLAPDPSAANRDALARSFILLVAYRFGLRGSEATGLRRSDWIEIEGHPTVVLVRPNAHRKLKSLAARRQIPLLFDLSSIEILIIQHWLSSFNSQLLVPSDGPLFTADANLVNLMDGKRLRNEVVGTLKHVTKNPGTTLHHARHQFANSVLLLLIDSPSVIWPEISDDTQRTPDRAQSARRLLLGNAEVSRRTLWALAGLMGHAHPSTAVRSYIHVLPDLASAYLCRTDSIESAVSDRTVLLGLDLDSYQPDATYLSNSPPPMVTADLEENWTVSHKKTVLFLVRWMRGTPSALAAQQIQIPSAFATQLLDAIHSVDNILDRRPQINPPNRGPSTLLGHIADVRWQTLYDQAALIRPRVVADQTILPDQKNLDLIIGISRHIVLSQESHFSFFRYVCGEWEIDEASYSVHFTESGKSNLVSMAKVAGFKIAAATFSNLQEHEDKNETPRRAVQIDSVILENGRLVVAQRCGVIAKTNSTSKVRSSHELVLMFLITITTQRFLTRRRDEG